MIVRKAGVANIDNFGHLLTALFDLVILVNSTTAQKVIAVGIFLQLIFQKSHRQ